MLMVVKKIVSLGKYTLLLAVFSALVHGGISWYAIKTAEKAIEKLPTKQIGLNYDSLEQGLCLSKVCLKVKNVSLQFKALGVNVCLGNVFLSKGVFSPYELSSGAYADKAAQESLVSTVAAAVSRLSGQNGATLEAASQSFSGEKPKVVDESAKTAPDCIWLTGSISGTKDFWQVNDLRFEQNGFGASLSGDIDARSQMIRLEGQTQGLADFVSRYIPTNYQLMAQLLLSNKKQDVSIRSDETHVRIFGLPLFPKKYIFNKLFQSLPF